MMSHELIQQFREDPQIVLGDWTERNNSGNLILIHRDAIYNRDDVEWMNYVYGLQFGEEELSYYLDENATLLGFYGGGGGSSYLLFEPL